MNDLTEEFKAAVRKCISLYKEEKKKRMEYEKALSELNKIKPISEMTEQEKREITSLFERSI